MINKMNINDKEFYIVSAFIATSGIDESDADNFKTYTLCGKFLTNQSDLDFKIYYYLNNEKPYTQILNDVQITKISNDIIDVIDFFSKKARVYETDEFFDQNFMKDDVTHGRFFGENINRVINTLKK